MTASDLRLFAFWLICLAVSLGVGAVTDGSLRWPKRWRRIRPSPPATAAPPVAPPPES